MSEFPSDPDAVSPVWLEQHLLDCGVIESEVGIAGLEWESIGTGQVGDSVRFHLTYSQPGAAPATIAAKFPAADERSRATAAMMGLYSKEVQFYRDAAPQLAVRVPQVFAAQVNAEGDRFVLLFEDLGPARGGDQIAGCSLEDACAAIKQAAAIHAPSWHNSNLLDPEWIRPRPEVTEQIAAMYPHAQSVFRERYADTLEPEFMELCDRLAATEELFSRRQEKPQCIVHGDFRLDNLLFDIRGGKEAIAVLDWQTVTTGKAMTDIGYFLGCGIGDDLRRAHEVELFDLYLAEMAKRGIRMDRDTAWHEYRVGALHGVSTAVFSAAFVERTPRGDANFLSMARGACALALEHDSLAALKETD